MGRQLSKKAYIGIGITTIFVVSLITLGFFYFFNRNASQSLQEVPTTFDTIQDPIIREALSNQIAQQTQKISTTSSLQSFTSQSTIDLRGHNEIRLQVTTSNENEQLSELRRIGDQFYVKDFTDNAWWSQELSDISGNTKAFTAESFLQQFKDLGNVSFAQLGKEVCAESKQCYKYKIERSNIQQDEYIWIDEAQLLLQKWTIQLGEVYTVTTLSYNIEPIETPSPTKPVSEGTVLDHLYDKTTQSLDSPPPRNEERLNDLKRQVEQEEKLTEEYMRQQELRRQ